MKLHTAPIEFLEGYSKFSCHHVQLKASSFAPILTAEELMETGLDRFRRGYSMGRDLNGHVIFFTHELQTAI